MTASRALVWFRNNLRIHDNRVLSKALQKHEEIVLIYVVDKRLWDESPIEQSNSSERRRFFLWNAIVALQSEIEGLGGSLVILKGRTQDKVVKAMTEYQCDTLYTTEEAGVYESEVLTDVEEMLMQKRIVVHTINEATLYHPDDIPWPINKLPAVFTQFRKENEKQTTIREVVDTPADLSKAKIKDFKKRTALDFEIDEVTPPEKGMNFLAGERAALDRLGYYLFETDLIKKYKETRNGMVGDDFSSKLSVYLANGSLSPRLAYQKLKEYEQEKGANQSTYWLFFELLWRDYFHFILKKYGAKLFSKNGIQEESYEWKQSKETFNKWCKGETGIPMIDANMRELNSTGYMSNRGRQLVASFLTHDLEIDWRWGAYYFERVLLDYDVASNWGNWAYVAGVGNDPRKNRYFNILSQAKRYDDSGDYVRLWLPELREIEGFNAHIVGLLKNKAVTDKITENKERYLNPIINVAKWDY